MKLHKVLLLLLVIFNGVDALCTVMWVSSGQATEANPVMAYILEYGAEWFILAKVGIVTSGCYFLARNAGNAATGYIAPLTGIYLIIVLYHLYYLIAT